MRAVYIATAAAIVLVLVEGILLSAFPVVMPSLLITAVLIAVHLPIRQGWLLALWSGLLLDLMSLQLFGVYTILAAGMFALAWLIIRSGLEMSRIINVCLIVVSMAAWQLVWRLALLAVGGWSGGEILQLARYGLWQAVFTIAVSLVVIRGFQRIIKV